MASPIAKHGRLIVNNVEFRWLPAAPHVFLIARIARAINCDAIGAEVIEITGPEIEAAAAHGYDYDVKPYAGGLTSVTAKVPLLLYRTSEGDLVLLDGRQRAFKALAAKTHVTGYVVSEADAIVVGRHPASAEIVRLVRQITDPAILATVRVVLKISGRQSVFAPIRELLHAAAAADQALAAVLKNFDSPGVHQDRYKLLESTRVKPVAFDTSALEDRASTKHINQVYHPSSQGRPKDEFRENRVKLYYDYFAIGLVVVEDAINHRRPIAPFNHNPNLVICDYTQGSGRLHQRRTRNYDDYLRKHWADMGLCEHHSAAGQKHKRLRRQKHDLCPKFDAIEEYASQTIGKIGQFVDYHALRKDMADSVENLAINMEELRNHRDGAVRQFRLLAKGFVRMRQWRPAKLCLLDMEASRTKPNPEDVTVAARWDLEGKNTLATLDEMIDFTHLTGIVATDIWPIHLEYNTLLECYALLHSIQHFERLGLRLSPTAVESFIYRARIETGGESDALSERWHTLFLKYNKFEKFATLVIKGTLNHIEAVQGLDLFESTDTPNGDDFLNSNLSYILSRLRAT